MKKLTITIEPGEIPASLATIEAARAALDKVRLSVSGLSTSFLGLLVVGFIGAKGLEVLGLRLGEQWGNIVCFLGMVGFLLSYRYERGPLARCIAALQPVPDSLLAETVLLAQRSPDTLAYWKAVREQKREFILAEYDALKMHVQAEPAEAARKILYG
jgi:hypothetical protein